MRKKWKGDHNMVGAIILAAVAVMVGVAVMGMVKRTGPENARQYTERAAKVMHSDGTPINSFD